MGREEGVIKSEVDAVLLILEQRGVQVFSGDRERMIACGDLDQVNAWARRALNATSTDDVLLPGEGDGTRT
ncbi:hypothetical protein [Actinomadura parmotrematis]|uniref:Uncharacterized protein n=1 Tax=Actinomadura parmotrematis TaxID=2864039 RepID=A0ABS7FMF9_9ACTN|nr:hypothetical protein [Actinomadura parmotrematis]MBW8481559.1 hypothetical protein [Actinomadura parmotrematis]